MKRIKEPSCKECDAKEICKDVLLSGCCLYGPEIQRIYNITNIWFEIKEPYVKKWTKDIQYIIADLIRKRTGC